MSYITCVSLMMTLKVETRRFIKHLKLSCVDFCIRNINRFILLLLTLILLTWRMWWVPNNASRWQMGCNWAFKGL